ncbi:hypothetical protein OCUAc20_07860 [Acinetobacter baumannii]|nr:hypothetical protein OCUAc20_07860 [Acinetobacter baumannii]SST06548.1 Uncharacterised protein [Acinetobacter baumannii]
MSSLAIKKAVFSANTFVMESLPVVNNDSIPIAQNKKLSFKLSELMDALYQFIETRNFSNKSLLKLLVSIGKHNSLNLEPILLRLSILFLCEKLKSTL